MKTLRILALSLFASLATTLYGQSKNSFYDVTKYLDKGGDFYLYMNTTDALKALNNQVDLIHKTIVSMPNVRPENKEDVDKGFNMFSKFLKESGLLEISGLGLSAKKDSTGLYKNTMFLHHFPEYGKGKLWSIFGKTSHKIDELEFLPDDTIIALYNDMEVGETWSWISDSVNNSGLTELKKGFSGFNKDALQNGVNIEDLLNSVDGGAGLLITMDKKNKITIPMDGGKGQQIPEPGIMIFIKVKNEKIFNLIQSKTMVGDDPKRHLTKRADKEGEKVLIFATGIPYIPGPAVIVQSEGYLMISSNMKLVDKVLAVKNNKIKGLNSTPEFKKLSSGLSLKGNGFQYVSSRTQEIITDFIKNTINSDPNADQEETKWMQNLFLNNDEKFTMLSINSVDKEGVFFRSKSNSSTGTILLTQATIAPIGIMAAMLLPALSMARESARKISCKNNLKQMGLAMYMYGDLYDDKYPNLDGAAGLDLLRSENLLKDPRIYICPSTNDQPATSGAKLSENNVSYVYFGGFTGSDPVDIPLAFDKPGNHDHYINILFLDGHVQGFAGNFKSCSDVVEFLIRKTQYSEHNKTKLREKAKKADLLMMK